MCHMRKNGSRLTIDCVNVRRFRQAFVSSFPLLTLSGLAACGGSASSSTNPTNSAKSATTATTSEPTSSAADTTVAPATTNDPNLLCGSSSVTGPVEEMEWGSKSFGTVAVTAYFTDAGDVCGATAKWEVPLGLSEDINEEAIPVLNKAVQSAKGANVQAVSGATATSQAYVKSLQAALDK